MSVKTVTVEALELHTYDGKSYDVGDTYEIDEQYADSVQTQGKAVRVDRAEKRTKAITKTSHHGSPVAIKLSRAAKAKTRRK